MTAIFSLPATEFALGTVLTPIAGVKADLERIVPAGDPVHYFWVSGDEHLSVTEELQTADVVREFTVVDELPDRALLRVHWNYIADGLLQVVADTGGVVLAATGTAEQWQFQIRFTTQAAMSRFYEACIDRGLSLTVHEFIPESPFPQTPFGVSKRQQEAIQVAFEQGYFDVPRSTTIMELADELGVSTQAVSERLRRGLTTLLQSTLASESRGADSTRVSADGDGTHD